VKNKSDDLIFYTTICAEASQIAYDATKKSPMRISLSISSAKRFGMEISMIIKESYPSRITFLVFLTKMYEYVMINRGLFINLAD
jgi:hypothetical protein